jgi:hypothetical protein
MKCVQPAQQKQSRAHALQATFFQIIISRIMHPYNVLKIKTYSPSFVEEIELH